MINRERLVVSVNALRHFINNSLGLSRQHEVSGFELSESLLDAAAYNTYVETVSNKADTLYLRAKESLTEMTTYSYLAFLKRLSDKFGWREKEIMLAFDHTDEDFYGDVQGFAIHGWTGKDGVTGKFKFLTCSIISDEIPEKIPLISIPAHVGDYKSYSILHCLNVIKPYIGKITLILFDRGFYDKSLMYELFQHNFPYLIFVPKNDQIKKELEAMDTGEKKLVRYEFEFKDDKTTIHGQTYQAFLKQIFCKKLEKDLDWTFATNSNNIELETIIKTYKKRWRIETGFRVQDEARIKCKSKEMKIRYFLFFFQQMLQTQWVCFFKDEATFKEFIIEMHNVCKDLVAHPKRSYGKV